MYPFCSAQQRWLEFVQICNVSVERLHDVRVGSWPRDNATEGVSGGLDQSIAAQRGRFEQIFPILVWKELWCALRAS
jgi:hypothetical protein